jgi:D-sedoheptulose 7-phosphate isomerase
MGGSAAHAQHLATEFFVRFRNNRPSLPALALTMDRSALTAIGDDFGFDQIFSRQIEGLGAAGDVAIAISTSGNSPNVLLALVAARARGLATIALTGGDGGKMRELADVTVIVPSKVTARIQEMHILIGHALCDAIERSFGYHR